MVNFRRLAKSFKYAFQGLGSVLRTEQNFRLHILGALILIMLAFVFELARWEWIVIIFMIALVFFMEMLNTVFERLVDMLKPRVHIFVHDIKNITAGMVLISAISAVIVALIIFVPKLSQFFEH
jgi:diacylglycerol kinase